MTIERNLAIISENPNLVNSMPNYLLEVVILATDIDSFCDLSEIGSHHQELPFFVKIINLIA